MEEETRREFLCHGAALVIGCAQPNGVNPGGSAIGSWSWSEYQPPIKG